MAKYCVLKRRVAVIYSTPFSIMLLFAALATSAAFGGERLLATGGVTQIEGAGGGGLTPWALITGLETNSEIGASADCTHVRPQHFSLTSCSAALGVLDRVELSYARQKFGLDDVVAGKSIRQDIVGLKVRAVGDAVFDQDRWLPQLSVGLQYKYNHDFDLVPRQLGARSRAGTDFYLAATKVFLAGPFSLSWLVDGTLRASRANQFGLLGFGGDLSNRYSYLGEGSVAVFLADSLVLGTEYRQKPDKISAFREQDSHDVFLAWFPTKYLSLTTAFVDLGRIATHANQKGLYVALQADY